MDKKELIKCKEVGCKLTGIRTERNEEGLIVYSFRTRHRGEMHSQTFTFAELIELGNVPLSEIRVYLEEKEKIEIKNSEV
ncbi:MAG TPA: hypothetical protein VK892_06390 [Pyrinomonadaceae bacterium]|nr:hypothetical protein [Pyrinomonadaceae bacterium]